MTIELENISVSKEGSTYQILHADHNDIIISYKKKAIFESLFPAGSKKKFKALIKKSGDKVYANDLINQKIPCDGSFIEIKKWDLLNEDTETLQVITQIDEDEIKLCLPLHRSDVKRKGQIKTLETSKKQEIKIAIKFDYDGYFIDSIQRTISGQFKVLAITNENGNCVFEGQLTPFGSKIGPMVKIDSNKISPFGQFAHFKGEHDLWKGVYFDITAVWNGGNYLNQIKKCIPCLKNTFKDNVISSGMLKLDDGTDLYRLKVEKSGAILYVKRGSFGYNGIHEIEESKPFFIELSFRDYKKENKHKVWKIKKIDGISNNLETNLIFEDTSSKEITKKDGSSYIKVLFNFKLVETPFSIKINKNQFEQYGITEIETSYPLEVVIKLNKDDYDKWEVNSIAGIPEEIDEALEFRKITYKEWPKGPPDEMYEFKLNQSPFSISVKVAQLLDKGIASIAEGKKLHLHLLLEESKTGWKNWKLKGTKLNLNVHLNKSSPNEIPVYPLFEWSAFSTPFAQGNPYNKLLRGFYSNGALLRTDFKQGVEFLLRASKPLLTSCSYYRLTSTTTGTVQLTKEITVVDSLPVFSISEIKFDVPEKTPPDDCFKDEAKYHKFEKKEHLFTLTKMQAEASYYEFEKETSKDEASPLLETLKKSGFINEVTFDVEVEKFRDKLIISKILAVKNINYAAR
jgi:hypothetical protein